MGGLFLLGGLASGLFLLFPVILILALLVILALRHDDDVDGNRAPAIYGSIVAFVGLLTLLFAATGLAASLLSLTADDSRGAVSLESPSGFDERDGFREFSSGGDDNDAAITSAVGFLIAGAAAAGLLFVHRSLFDPRRYAAGAALRVHRAYLLLLCLVTAVIAMIAAGMGIYALYRTLFPGTAGADNRADELRALLTLVVLFVGAGGLWRYHWDELDLGRGPDDPVSATAVP